MVKRKRVLAIIYFCIFTSVFILGVMSFRSIKNMIYRSKFAAETHTNKVSGDTLNYRLFIPSDYKKSKLPLIVYLHPWGVGGNDNKKHINELTACWSGRKSQKENPCFILAPQCPANKEWADKGIMKAPFTHYNQDQQKETVEMKMIIDLVHQLADTYPIDMSRIYCVGFSMGATGCWDILTRYPETFAASVIASGSSDVSKASRLTHIPIQAFCGEYDPVAPPDLNRNMVEAINKTGGNAQFTMIKEKGHNIGYEVFSDRSVRNWLFSQIRN